MIYSLDEFEKEFNIFQSEVNYGMKNMVLHFAINQSGLVDSRPLNKIPEYFNFQMYNLILSAILCLARIFDETSSSHGINTFLDLLGKNIGEFKFDKLAERQEKNYPGYFDNKVEFDIEMYRVIKKKSNQLRKQYKETFKDYRNKIIAHREVYKSIELKNNEFSYKQLLDIFIELHNISNEVWQRYYNGKGYSKVTYEDILEWVSLENEIPNGKPFFRFLIEDYKTLYKTLSE